MRSKNNIPQEKTWIEISRSALLHNLKEFKKIAGPKTLVACVVKANAYGHGLRPVAEILKGYCDWFCVDSVEEGLALRALTPKPVLILGYTPLPGLRQAIENDLSMVVYNPESIEKIVSLNLAKKARLHIKIETGLNRQGVKASDLLKFAKSILRHPGKMYLEGLSTHFANIEDTLDPSFANLQLSNFKEAVKVLRQNRINPPYIHASASAGTILYPKAHFTMVRLGIALYGLWPSKETHIASSLSKKRLTIRPVLFWKSIVAQIKDISKGDSVGYGRTWIASRKTKLAVIPVGYSDGYSRSLSNFSRVLIKGKFAPVVGRVAMNMIVADVTAINNISLEDKVTLIGSDGNKTISVDELAGLGGTINYEVIARLNPNIARVVVD